MTTIAAISETRAIDVTAMTDEELKAVVDKAIAYSCPFTATQVANPLPPTPYKTICYEVIRAFGFKLEPGELGSNGYGTSPRFAAHPAADAAHAELARRAIPVCQRLDEQAAQYKKDRLRREGEEWFHSHIPSGYHNCRFDTYQPQNASQQKALDAMLNWAITPPFVMIGGATGIGKSHLAIAYVAHLAHHGCRPTVVEETACLKCWQSLHANFERRDEDAELPTDYLEELATCPFLVWDDFGSAKLTDASAAVVWYVLHERLTNNRPTILTTNFRANELAKIREPKLISRVTSGLNMWVEGEDQRGRAMPNGGLRE